MAHYPPPNNPKVVKVSLIFARDSREAVNTFYVSKESYWNLADMTQLANAVRTWYDTVYKLAVPSSISLVQVQVRLLDPNNPLAYDLPVSPGIPGTRGTPAAPANVTATLSERTGLAGRAYRGRFYVPGIVEPDISTDDRLTSGIVALLYNAIANLVFGSLPAGMLLSVFHRPHLLPHPLDNTFNVVNTGVIENIVDSQRRRLPGRGR